MQSNPMQNLVLLFVLFAHGALVLTRLVLVGRACNKILHLAIRVCGIYLEYSRNKINTLSLLLSAYCLMNRQVVQKSFLLSCITVRAAWG